MWLKLKFRASYYTPRLQSRVTLKVFPFSKPKESSFMYKSKIREDIGQV
jgi:hypothetical protein